jgi:hypothetical protein
VSGRALIGIFEFLRVLIDSQVSYNTEFECVCLIIDRAFDLPFKFQTY